MICRYHYGNLDLSIYEKDIKELIEGKNLECITWGNKELLIQLKLTNKIRYDQFKMEGFYQEEKLRTCKIRVHEEKFKDYISGEKGIELLGTRGPENSLPLDRISIVPYDFDGTNAEKKFNPLIKNPELKKNYPI